ncbi:MAG: hypothetical protein ACOY46_04135 [Bacillota bacterium]
MERCLLTLKKIRKSFLGKMNVIGIGAGMKQVGLERTKQPSVIVFVEKKLSKGELSRKEIIPETIDGVFTDVIEIGKVRLLDGRTDKIRPARPGSSIGHHKITAGTFGAVVRDIKTGEPLILSNNHILANGSDGKDGRSSPGDPILQPGPYDGGKEGDRIADLLRFWPLVRKVKPADCPVATGAAKVGSKLVHIIRPNYDIHFVRTNQDDNIIDAALARPVSRDIISADIMEIGTPRGTAVPDVNLKVMKSGRSSGLTSGGITAIDVTLEVELDDAGNVGYFSSQIVCDMLSRGGDSGSLVMDDQMRAVGLLFAGSDKYTIFNQLNNVFSRLGVELA